MALTFDVSNNIKPDGITVATMENAERPYFASKAIKFTDKTGDGTALQSGETVNLMVLGNNCVVTKAFLRITTAFTTGIDIGFMEDEDGTKDRDEFFDGVASVGTYIYEGHSTGAATAAITAASTNPVTSTKDDYCITLDAKANQTGGGVGYLVVEYVVFPE